MAVLEGLQAVLQINAATSSEPQKWCTLEEFETQATVAESMNSKHRWTTAVQASERPFRLVISTQSHFDWRGYNALNLSLSFDKGYRVNEYPITILKDRNRAQLDHFPTLGCMQQSMYEDVDKEYALESLYLPMDVTESKKSSIHFRHIFAFKKFEALPRIVKLDHYTSALHSVRLSIQRANIRSGKEISLRLKTISPHNTDEEIVRATLISHGVNLGICTNWTEQYVEKLPQPSVCTSTEKKTFVFVYYGEAESQKLDDVDVVDLSRPVQDCENHHVPLSSINAHAGTARSSLAHPLGSPDTSGKDLSLFLPDHESPREPLHGGKDDQITIYTSVAQPEFSSPVAYGLDPEAPESKVLQEIVRNVQISYRARTEAIKVQTNLVSNLRSEIHVNLQHIRDLSSEIKTKQQTISNLEKDIDLCVNRRAELEFHRTKLEIRLSDARTALDATGDAQTSENAYLNGVRKEAQNLKEQQLKVLDDTNSIARTTRKRRRHDSPQSSIRAENFARLNTNQEIYGHNTNVSLTRQIPATPFL